MRFSYLLMFVLHQDGMLQCSLVNLFINNTSIAFYIFIRS
jgi:hypothetical protein